MFDPNKAKAKKSEDSKKKQLIKQITDKSMLLVPEYLREGLILSINEIACGDPSCSPVDTVFTFVWAEKEGELKEKNGNTEDEEGGARGMFAIPMTIEEILKENLEEMFPVSII